jgi:ABC-type branched-subunit amino acid transport system ATPase component
VKLLIAVLVGGAETVFGPAVGLISLVVASRLAGGLGDLLGRSRERFEPVATALLLVPVLLLGGRGLVRRRRPLPAVLPDLPPVHWHGGGLGVHEVTVAFGGVVALDRVSLTIAPGRCHAVVGHNGSGKSTLLKVMAGAIAPSAGGVDRDGRVARTLQRLALAPEMTILEHAVSGAEPARTTSLAQALLATPRSRAEDETIEQKALQILGFLGLSDRAGSVAAELDSAEQRLVQIARALAAEPDIILLDEPAAGLGRAEQQRLIGVLVGLREAGLTLVLVEHRTAVVEALADELTVLEAGRVVHGDPIALFPI